MAKKLTNFPKKSLFLTLLLVVFVVFGSGVAVFAQNQIVETEAVTSLIATQAKFNDDPNDYATVRVSNYTNYPNSTQHWFSSVDVQPGDIVSVAIYYHNTSSVNAENVVVSITVPSTVGTMIDVSGGLIAQNADSVYGSASVNLSSPENLTYIPGSAKWYPNQSQTISTAFPDQQTGDEVVAGGVNIGDIAPGWDTQGSVVARFQVSQSATPLGSVDMKANGSDGPLTLGYRESFSLDWTSKAVSSCVLKSVGIFESGVELNGNSGEIDYKHPYYPAVGGEREFIITCQSNTGGEAADSVIIKRPFEAPTAPFVYGQFSGQCGGLINLWWEDVVGADGYKIYRGGQFIASTTDINFVDSNLVPLQQYSYTVRAYNQGGESPDSNIRVAQASAECPPFSSGPVLDAFTDSSCGGKILLSWSELPGAVEYLVVRGQNTLIYQGNGTSTTDVALTPGALYSYVVIAKNSQGEESPVSNIAKANASAACAVAPEAPVILAKTSSQCGGQIEVFWNQASGATSYEIYRDNVKIGQTNQNFYTDTGLDTNTLYSYKVKSINNIGSSNFSNISSAEASGACATVPEAPILGASTGSECGGQIILTWNSIGNAQGYKIFRGEEQIATTSETTYTDTSLNPSTSYTYTVRSFNNIGESVDSNPASTMSSEGCGEIPTVTLTADPSTIFKGQNSTLSWTSTNANFCEASWTSSKNTSGSQKVSPETTTEYSVKCKSNVGEVTASVTVTVLLPVCSLPEINSSLQADARLDEMFDYTITTSNLGTTTISVDEEALPSGLHFSGNKISGTPSETGTFNVKITAENSCGKTDAILIITVSGGGNGGGTPSMGSITVCKIIFDNKGQIATSSNNLPSGLFIIKIKTSTSTDAFSIVDLSFNTSSYIAITEILDGTYAQCATIPVPLGDYYYDRELITGNNWLEPLYNDEFEKNISSFSHLYSFSPELFDNDPNNDSNRNIKSDGLIAIRDLTAHKTLLIANTYSSTTTPPETVSVQLSADPSTIVKGQNSTLSWTSQNAVSCGAPWTTATSTSGSQIVTPDSTTSYTISCTGQSGTASSTATVTVTANGGGNNNPTVSISANPGTINSGATSTLTWASTNTNSCSAIWTSATSTSGSFNVSPTSTIDYGITCTGTGGSASATTTVTVATSNGGGGGGGGSSSGGGSRSGDRNRPISGVPSTPQVLGAESCEYLRDFLRIDWNNDLAEVVKLQVFLKTFEDFELLPINGVFDQATFDAVSIFQERYFDDILAPWGHESSTGFVYITTRKKVNEIVCQRAFPLTVQQEEEIKLFHEFLSLLESRGISTSSFTQVATTVESEGSIDSGSWSGVGLSLSEAKSEAERIIAEKDLEEERVFPGITKNKTFSAAAAAIFSGPQNTRESVAAVLSLLLILGIVHFAVRALLKKQEVHTLPLDVRRARRIVYFIVGVVIALLVLVAVKYLVIVLPLLILIVALALTLLFLSLRKKEARTLMKVD